jgi:hypothetical protein
MRVASKKTNELLAVAEDARGRIGRIPNSLGSVGTEIGCFVLEQWLK